MRILDGSGLLNIDSVDPTIAQPLSYPATSKPARYLFCTTGVAVAVKARMVAPGT